MKIHQAWEIKADKTNCKNPPVETKKGFSENSKNPQNSKTEFRY